MRLGTGLLLAILACAFVAPADASGGRAEVAKTIENSMLVTGSVDIAIDGTVATHRLDQPEKLPQVVRDLIAKAMPLLRFEPVEVNGEPVTARTKMGLRVVATKLDDGNYRLRLANASFGEAGGVEGETVTSVELEPPRYPAAAYMSNVSGTVYLVLKIGRDGRVEDAVAEQTNLTVLGNERQMRKSRNMLEAASIAAARKWRFNVPLRGEEAGQAFWLVRVPVDFDLRVTESSPPPSIPYGTWEAYIPGPKNRVPWITEEENRRNPDALADGGVYVVGTGPRLLTPLGEG